MLLIYPRNAKLTDDSTARETSSRPDLTAGLRRRVGSTPYAKVEIHARLNNEGTVQEAHSLTRLICRRLSHKTCSSTLDAVLMAFSNSSGSATEKSRRTGETGWTSNWRRT